MSKSGGVAMGLALVAAGLAGAALLRTMSPAGAGAEEAHEGAHAEPHLGETMTRVQGLFADLYFAGQGQNWELAGYLLHELEETFAEVPVILREENGVPLKPLVDVVLGTTIPALEEAAAAKDYTRFLNRYMDAVSTCNACHAQTGHGYLAVKVPDAPHTRVLEWKP